MKRKNESVGSAKYNGRDWFWPHDYRHYLRDASPAQRKKIHDAWLKIGVPVKGTGLKISDRYLEPKKNQLKKAWTIVRKVVAPKELGMPIPESVSVVDEACQKGYMTHPTRKTKVMFGKRYRNCVKKEGKKQHLRVVYPFPCAFICVFKVCIHISYNILGSERLGGDYLFPLYAKERRKLNKRKRRQREVRN